MSFRHTFITEYFYKYGKEDTLAKILQVLEEYSDNVKFEKGGGKDYYGYFHGTIKDSDGLTVKNKEAQELKEKLAKLDCKIEIVFE